MGSLLNNQYNLSNVLFFVFLFFYLLPHVSFSNLKSYLVTVYETCKLGTHSPLICGSQMELSSGRSLPSGLVLVDCPQQVKVAGNNLYSINSISDYFMTLSKCWSVKRFVSALAKVIRDLKLGTNSSQNLKEGGAGPCTVCFPILLSPFYIRFYDCY